MSTIEDRLAALNIDLPAPVAPVANYVPFVRSGDLVYISGQVSIDADRRDQGRGRRGRRPGRRAQAAARLCGINLLAQMKAACEGDSRPGGAGGEAGRLRPGRAGLLRHPQGDQRLLGPDGRGVRRRRPPRPLGRRRLSPAAELRRRGRRGGRSWHERASSARPGSGCSARRSPIAACGRRTGRRRTRWAPSRPPCAAGYGIELDVQLSADGEAMVFHDATLERMTGGRGPASPTTPPPISAS